MSVAGRKVKLYKLSGTEYELIGALKSKSTSINNEPIDVTTDDDDGYRKYIEDVSGTRSCDIKAEGVFKSRAALLELADGQAAIVLRFVVPGTTDAGAQIDGTFKMSNMELGAELEDGVTFSASFGSSGTFTIGAVTP